MAGNSKTIDSPAGRCSRPRSWFDRGILAATLLTCAVALSPNVPDPDLWGHVRYGYDLLREGLPATTTYSFTAVGYPWVNHENLAEILLAVGMETVGPAGLLIVKCLLGVGVVSLIMVFGLRRRLAIMSVCVVALLVAVNLTYFWCMRPQLMSLICYALLLSLLTWCFAGWEGSCRIPWIARFEQADCRHEPWSYSSRRLRFLWLAPPIFLVWTNSHGGFVAGFCIYAAYLFGRSIEAWAMRGREAWGLIARFTMMVSAAGLATFLNPYSFGLHRWVSQSLGTPRPEIMEWRAPDMTSSLMLPLWLIVITWLAVLLLSKHSRDLTHLLILGVTLWQALTHQRHVPFFALPFGLWMAVHVDSVLRRYHIVKDDQPAAPLASRAWKWSLASAMVAVFFVLGYRLYDRVREMPVQRSEYPVAAFQYMADHNLNGNLVVTFNWAQYAIASFGPRYVHEPGSLVSFDGRFRTCYPQEVVDMNFDFVLGQHEPRHRSPNSPQFDDERVLEFGQPDLVLINRHQPHSVNVMFRNRDRWTLLYQDSVAQLWGRSAKYDDPASPAYVPAPLRHITEEEQTGTVAWPALPLRRDWCELARESHHEPS